MIKYIKRAIITKALDKRKKGKEFDIELSDNYTLPHGASGDMNNSHYFFAADFTGKECLYFRLAKRGGNSADEVWLTYRSPDGVVYMAAADHIEKGGYIPAAVECGQPGKSMSFSYDGDAVPAKKTERGYVPDNKAVPVKLKLSGKFEGVSECFEFSHHLSSKPMAIAISKEKIDKEKLREFENNHQVHYEQGGKLYADITVGKKSYKIDGLSAFRDHSYGRRDWAYFDRYVWTMALLENGDFVHTSFIRYPALKHLQAGFYIPSGGKAVSLLEASPVEEIKVPDYGNVPQSFGFDVKYVDGTKRSFDCKLDFVCPFMFAGDFNVNEGLSEFTVNGIKGVGITEFAFNKDRSRWGI